jgi:hypothetical protein
MKRFVAFIAFSLPFLWSMTTLGQSATYQSQQSVPAPRQTDSGKAKVTPDGVEILSDTQGVDFSSYLHQWHQITSVTWNKLIPAEVNPPGHKKGVVVIRFKILPNGKLMEHSMILEGRSGDAGLDHAAWSALTDSDYPPLPLAFHGPYLEFRAVFLYNVKIKENRIR